MVENRIQVRQNYRPPLITLFVDKAGNPLITIFFPIRDKTILLEPVSSKHVPEFFLDISLKDHLFPECQKLEHFQFELAQVVYVPEVDTFKKRLQSGNSLECLTGGYKKISQRRLVTSP